MHFDAKARPDWFPLPEYSKDLEPEEWGGALIWRLAVRQVWNNTKDPEKARSAFLSLLVDGDNTDSAAVLEILVGEPPYDLAVREINTFEAHYLAALNASEEGVRGQANQFATNPSQALAESTTDRPRLPSAMAAVTESGLFDVLCGRVALSVNIYADDETLKRDFDLWLALSKRDHPGRGIAQKDFRRWKDLQVLAAFDLALWAEIHGAKYTAAFMGDMLWADPDRTKGFVDTTERYRKLTRPLVEDIFHWGSVERLGAQLRSEKVRKNIESLHQSHLEGKISPDD